jgi:hypothetical protein
VRATWAPLALQKLRPWLCSDVQTILNIFAYIVHD